MWETLTWPELHNEQIRDTADELRRQTLRLVLAVATAGYIAWQLASTFLAPHQDAPRSWIMFPVVVPGLLVTTILSKRESRLALYVLLGASVASISAAASLLDGPAAMRLYPLVVLVAVVLVHPLAGLVVTAGIAGLLVVLQAAGPLAGVGADLLVETVVISLVTIVAASALGRDTLITTQWWLTSYEEALRKTREAQDHRGQMIRAMSQINTAYLRLQQANAALEIAWRAAEAAEHSKTEFVTNISHELRTPLNLIIGFSEMILNSPESYGVPLPASYRVDLNAVYRSAQHLLALTNDVIDLARIGGERLALDLEPVELGPTIGEACDLVREYIALKGLQLCVEVPTDVPPLHADRLRIRQVLLNLLTNAARFTERGSITVTAGVEPDRVVVRVADTGRGIAPEVLPRVFEEFYHGEDERSLAATGLGGIGLGLPISRRLIELHGGDMGVESVVGAGTTFWFNLPVGGARATGRNGSTPWSSSAAAPTAERRPVVLVSKDFRLTRFFQQHLRGYSVITAPDLSQAITSARQTHATGILVDTDAPEPDVGEETSVPIVRLPLPRGERMASALEATAYVDKPVTQSELSAVLAGLGHPVRSALVIDDDPGFADLMGRMLKVSTRDEDLRIRSARNGREGLEMLTQLQPDLVILDLLMPELGGRETLAAIRADSRFSDLPVIMISAQSQLEDQLRLRGPLSVWREDGFQLDELLGAVEALLNLLGHLRPAD